MEIELIKKGLEEIKNQYGEIKSQQRIQSKAMDEVLLTLRGSVALGLDGMMIEHKQVKQRLDGFDHRIELIEDWRQEIVDSKGKITITIGALFTRSMAVIGAVGTIVAVVLGLKELLL